MQNNYFYKWIDCNKDDEIYSFKECIDSYIYFKKDAFYKTNKLIKGVAARTNTYKNYTLITNVVDYNQNLIVTANGR